MQDGLPNPIRLRGVQMVSGKGLGFCVCQYTDFFYNMPRKQSVSGNTQMSDMQSSQPQHFANSPRHSLALKLKKKKSLNAPPLKTISIPFRECSLTFLSVWPWLWTTPLVSYGPWVSQRKPDKDCRVWNRQVRVPRGGARRFLPRPISFMPTASLRPVKMDFGTCSCFLPTL